MILREDHLRRVKIKVVQEKIPKKPLILFDVDQKTISDPSKLRSVRKIAFKNFKSATSNTKLVFNFLQQNCLIDCIKCFSYM